MVATIRARYRASCGARRAIMVCNGIEAVEAVREERFDAIIMDLEMPQLNG